MASSNGIEHINTKNENRRRLPFFIKKKNNTVWVQIATESRIKTIFYAINAGLSHLLIPLYTGKVRIMQNNGQVSVLTKYKDDYLSLADSNFYTHTLHLDQLKDKFLSPETVRSVAAVLVEWYVLQEADCNVGNIGFTESKKNVYRLDYDYTLFDFISTELQIDKNKMGSNYQSIVNANEARFPITQSDLENFPDCKDIRPIHYMGLNRNNAPDVDFLKSLNKNQNFMKYADLYFLKSILLSPQDIRAHFDMHVTRNGEGLRRRYVNYVDQRIKDLKLKLFSTQRFRENFRNYFDEYKQVIIEEFTYYNREHKAEYRIDVEEIKNKLDLIYTEYLPLYEQLASLEAVIDHKELFQSCRILLDMESLESVQNFIQIIAVLLAEDDVSILTRSVKYAIQEELKLILEEHIILLKTIDINPYRLALLELIDKVLEATDGISDQNIVIELLIGTTQYSEDLLSIIDNGQMTDKVFADALHEYRNEVNDQLGENIKNNDYKTKALLVHQERLRLKTNSQDAHELADLVEYLADYLNSKAGLKLNLDMRLRIFASTNEMCNDFYFDLQNSMITEELFEWAINGFFEAHQDLLPNLFEYCDRKVRSLMFEIYLKNDDTLSQLSEHMADMCLYAQELSHENGLLVACSFLIKMNNILRITNKYQHQKKNAFEKIAQDIAAEMNRPNIILGKHRSVKKHLYSLMCWIVKLLSPSNSSAILNNQYGFLTNRLPLPPADTTPTQQYFLSLSI